MTRQPLGITLNTPTGQEATGVYQDENGVEVFVTNEPYLLEDGRSLSSPLPVFDAGGPTFLSRKGTRQRSLAINGLGPLPFYPSSLFANGEQGAWYDPSDLTTLFQDSAGTVPVTADGDPVGRMLDKSGNGNHATQAVDASRPTYRTDGALHWLELDGSKGLAVVSPIAWGTDESTAVVGCSREISAGDRVILEFPLPSTGVTNAFTMFSNPTTARYQGRGDGTNAVATVAIAEPWTAVITGLGKISTDTQICHVNGAQASSAVDQGAGNYGDNTLWIGRRSNGNAGWIGNFYGVIIRNALTVDGDLTNAEAWMAAKTGVTL